MINFNFWRPREKFLILEIAPQKTSGLLLSLDAGRNLIPEKSWNNLQFDELSRRLKSLRKRKIIVSAHPTLATTVTFPAELKRESDNFIKPLTITELENLLAQEIGKIFNQRRSEAASKLKLHEIDTILVNYRVMGLKIDDHLVLNPIGFTGKTIKAVLELTFTTRGIFEYLKNIFNADGGFFFTELSRAALSSIAKIQEPPIGLLLLGVGKGRYFMLEKAAWGRVVYESGLGWSLGELLEAISLAFQASHGVVLELYEKYLKNDMSEHFRRSLGRVIRPVMMGFAKKLKESKLRGRVYLYSPLPLPIRTPSTIGGVSLNDLPLGGVTDKLGFRINLAQWQLPPDDVFTKLAPFFEFYGDKSDSEINQKLRRRLHWLIR